MTLFKLVKIALDELYAQGVKQYGGDLDGKINGQMEYLTEVYKHLTDPNRTPVEYSDPATRFAYVNKYVATHGDFIVQILDRLREQTGTKLFNDKKLKLTCVGGGPGSDIIGVLKYLDNHPTESVKKLTCYLLDKQQAWADTWTEFDDSLTGDLVVSTNFQPLDVTDPDSYKHQIKFLDADLFTLSYFVSEVHSLDQHGEVASFFKTLFAQAKSGAYFVYDDNWTDIWTDYFDALWKDAGLKLVIEETNVEWYPQHTEQKSDLGEYLSKFGQSPNLKKRLSMRVLKKP